MSVITLDLSSPRVPLEGPEIGICGQAPSDYPDFAQFLVEHGIDSIFRPSDMTQGDMAMFAHALSIAVASRPRLQFSCEEPRALMARSANS
jgi:hypothetical protein